ncbi:hypothetical protein QR680_014695 [Steinernema hermaphroditum]|uniref:C-type lectin domain-containing protein n=1 Tax=Steinernema hermaphroditum TaxID=289476 RepID=A0AA39IBG0_9BILA|nr:hypothetical protein QR680_014695 [Steinernema hermaphroditum]
MIGRCVLISFLTFSAFLPALPVAENASGRSVENSDFWYVINSNNLSFEEAEEHCITLKGHLASIHSAAEHNVVKELLKLHGIEDDYAVRLGGHRLPNTTTFIWTDQSAWDFDEWYSRQPKEGDTVITFYGGWVAIDREENLISVCKVPASSLRKAMKSMINNK